MNEGNNFVTALEQAIEAGHKLDVDFLIGIDDMAEAIEDAFRYDNIIHIIY